LRPIAAKEAIDRPLVEIEGVTAAVAGVFDRIAADKNHYAGYQRMNGIISQTYISSLDIIN
jgi:hypothetical protein